jgi:hypothetical protein
VRFALPTVARSVDDTDLSDLTTAARTGPAVWADDGSLDIPFDRDLTDTEVAAISNRLLTTDAAKEAIRWVLVQYTANEAPTAEETRQAWDTIAEAVMVYVLGV